MEISPLLKVLVVMNNYFHDVATGLLLSSAVILWAVGTIAKSQAPESRAWFPQAYRLLTRFAWFALAWIVVGGVPRTIFFEQVEWNLADPSNMHLFSALMVKHAMMWVAVFIGGWMWLRMRRLANELEIPVVAAPARSEAN